MTNHDRLKQTLQEKEPAILPDNFESNMMDMLHKHALEKKTEKKYMRMMYLFFGLGTVLGLFAASTFANKELLFAGRTFMVSKLVFIVPILLIVLLLFEKIYKATMVFLGKDEFSPF